MFETDLFEMEPFEFTGGVHEDAFEEELSPCIQQCKDALDRCLDNTRFPPECLARWGTCTRGCEPPPPPPPRPPSPPPSPPGPTPAPPTLRQGSRGAAVSTAQALLNRHGAASPPLAVDGAFGPKTAAAVRRFQRSRGLVVDGVIGPKTWGALLGS